MVVRIRRSQPGVKLVIGLVILGGALVAAGGAVLGPIGLLIALLVPRRTVV